MDRRGFMGLMGALLPGAFLHHQSCLPLYGLRSPKPEPVPVAVVDMATSSRSWTVAATYTGSIEAGTLTLNEIRVLEGLKPYGDRKRTK